MSDYVGMHSQCCQECSRPQCGWCHNPWPCPTFELAAAQATIAQRDAQVAAWEMIADDLSDRLFDEGSKLAARDAQVADLTRQLHAEKRAYARLERDHAVTVDAMTAYRDERATVQAHVAELTAMFEVREYDDGTYSVSVPVRHWEQIRALLERTPAAPDEQAP